MYNFYSRWVYSGIILESHKVIDQMVQWVKAPVARHNALNCILGTNMMEEKNQFPKVVL